MRKLFKERKLFKGGNYMRKYGKCQRNVPSNLPGNRYVSIFSQSHDLKMQNFSKISETHCIYVNHKTICALFNMIH